MRPQGHAQYIRVIRKFVRVVNLGNLPNSAHPFKNISKKLPLAAEYCAPIDVLPGCQNLDDINAQVDLVLRLRHAGLPSKSMRRPSQYLFGKTQIANTQFKLCFWSLFKHSLEIPEGHQVFWMVNIQNVQDSLQPILLIPCCFTTVSKLSNYFHVVCSRIAWGHAMLHPRKHLI